MANRFWVGGTGTWDAADTTHWASSSNGAGGQSVPGSGDTVTFDGSSGGGTVTVNATINVTSITAGAFTGTLDFATNNNNVTAQTVSFSGTGTRTINLGNGTWTITGTTGTVWDNTTVTNETLNANSSTVLITATPTGQRFVALGAKTYNVVQITDVGTFRAPLDVSGAATVATLTLTNVQWLRIQGSVTLTVTNAITWTGTAAQPAFLDSNATNGSKATLSVGAACTLSFAFIRNITKAGAGSITATNSFDGGGNTSITITGPSGGAHIIGG